MAETASRRRPLRSVRTVAAFIEREGVVLVSARGPVPSVTEAIAGEAVRGSWWGHPQGKLMYAILSEVTEAKDVVVCRAVRGKMTIVHRRLWPALVAASARFEPAALARVASVHTEHGHHERVETPFPAWVPASVSRAAARLSVDEAIDALGEWAREPAWPAPRASSRRPRGRAAPPTYSDAHGRRDA